MNNHPPKENPRDRVRIAGVDEVRQLPTRRQPSDLTSSAHPSDDKSSPRKVSALLTRASRTVRTSACECPRGRNTTDGIRVSDKYSVLACSYILPIFHLPLVVPSNNPITPLRASGVVTRPTNFVKKGGARK